LKILPFKKGKLIRLNQNYSGSLESFFSHFFPHSSLFDQNRLARPADENDKAVSILMTLSEISKQQVKRLQINRSSAGLPFVLLERYLLRFP